MSVYKPLRILDHQVVGIGWSLKAMRLPMLDSKTMGNGEYTFEDDLNLASRLVKGGDDHAKALRGCIVYLTLEMQTGFMIEFETYRHGVECLSTSSAMHGELKGLSGPQLAEAKQEALPERVYTRTLTMSYQALRNIYKARRYHRHPDWQIFSKFIEGLPHFEELIYPEVK